MSPGACTCSGGGYTAEEVNLILRNCAKTLFAGGAGWLHDAVTISNAGRPDGTDDAAMVAWTENLSLSHLLRQSTLGVGFTVSTGDNHVGSIDVDFFVDQGFIAVTGGVSLTSGRARELASVEISMVNGPPSSGTVGPNNFLKLTLGELMSWAWSVSSAEPSPAGRNTDDARRLFLALIETSLLYEQEGRVPGPLTLP